MSFPPTKLLSPIWEPRPGLGLNDFKGSASLSPVPVHIDGADLEGGKRDRFYSISSSATECMGGA